MSPLVHQRASPRSGSMLVRTTCCGHSIDRTVAVVLQTADSPGPTGAVLERTGRRPPEDTHYSAFLLRSVGSGGAREPLHPLPGRLRGDRARRRVAPVAHDLPVGLARAGGVAGVLEGEAQVLRRTHVGDGVLAEEAVVDRPPQERDGLFVSLREREHVTGRCVAV